MDINELVKSIVGPFLKEEASDLQTPVFVPKDAPPELGCDNKYTDSDDECDASIDECGMLKNLLGFSEIPAIKRLGSAAPHDMLKGFMGSHHPGIDSSWEEKNKHMADKLGYDLIDYIGGEEDRGIDMTLSPEDTFRDTCGVVHEDISHRQKIRRMIEENDLKKKFIKSHKSNIVSMLKEGTNISSNVNGGTRDIAPFSTLAGYKSFANDRATTAGYQIVKELFDDDQVFAVENVELQVTANTVKIYGEKPNDSNMTKLEETFSKIGNLFQEFITGKHELNTDGADKIGTFGSGGIGKGDSKESCQGTPPMELNAHKTPPKTKLNYGDKPITKKPYTDVVDDSGDMEIIKKI